MKKLFKNKKAETSDFLYWTIAIPLTAFVIISIISTANALVNTSLETYKLESYVYSKRVINALSYEDELTGNFYYGTLDITKLNEGTLTKYLSGKRDFDEEFGIAVKIYYLKNYNPDYKEYYKKNKIPADFTVYYNKKGYEISNIFHSITNNHYVFVKDKEHLIPAKLEITVAYHKNKYND
jgi:hypothetical protein